VANNRTPFPEESVTYASLLRASGYATGYVGKWHMGRQRGPRPGFDYSASFIGQGRYVDCPFEIEGVQTPTTGWVDDVSTDYAIKFMEQHRDQPFALIVGFKTTHGPFQPPDRAAERFAGGRARPAPNLGVRAIYSREGDAENRKGKAGGARRTGKSNINLNYFRCISAADDNLGRLLNTLEQLGLAEDTVVVFTSDNGFYHGEHGLSDKRSGYDESLRIPFLVRYPRAFPRDESRDDLVLNIDLAPTLLDLAGVAIPREMQGRSWAPLLTGQATNWRESFLAEYFLENAFPQTPTFVAVRTKTAKLIKFPGHDDWTELFDLANDPYETKNLAAEPEYNALLAQMNEELDKQVKRTSFLVPDYADSRKEDSKLNAE
jgi:arylsulfatase A-like enzyme